MHRATFVKLSALAFGLLLAAFVLRGFSLLVVSPDIARLISAPPMLTAGALIVFLTVRSGLAVTGIRPLED